MRIRSNRNEFSLRYICICIWLWLFLCKSVWLTVTVMYILVSVIASVWHRGRQYFFVALSFLIFACIIFFFCHNTQKHSARKTNSIRNSFCDISKWERVKKKGKLLQNCHHYNISIEMWIGKWKTISKPYPYIDFRPSHLVIEHIWRQFGQHTHTHKHTIYPENMVPIEKPSIWCDENEKRVRVQSRSEQSLAVAKNEDESITLCNINYFLNPRDGRLIYVHVFGFGMWYEWDSTSNTRTHIRNLILWSKLLLVWRYPNMHVWKLSRSQTDIRIGCRVSWEKMK